MFRKNIHPWLATLSFSTYLENISGIRALLHNCPKLNVPSRDCNKPFPCSFGLVGLWPEPSLGRNISLPPCNCSGNSEHNPENGRLWLHLYRKIYILEEGYFMIRRKSCKSF